MSTIIPTWDLFILIFFAIVVTYSFIIGRDKTVKITIASYISILTADGVGNMMEKYFFGLDPVVIIPQLQLGGFENNYSIIAKILAFALFLVLLMLKGNFVADIHDGDNSAVSFIITALMGALSAGLLVSAVLVYMSNGSFLMGVPFLQTDLMTSIYDQSFLAKLMIDYIDVWFVLPAVTFIIGSITNE
jgi:hypothetical protein